MKVVAAVVQSLSLPLSLSVTVHMCTSATGVGCMTSWHHHHHHHHGRTTHSCVCAAIAFCTTGCNYFERERSVTCLISDLDEALRSFPATKASILKATKDQTWSPKPQLRFRRRAQVPGGRPANPGQRCEEALHRYSRHFLVWFALPCAPTGRLTLSSPVRTGKVSLEKPLHLVIGSVSPTAVLLSWGSYLKTPYDGNIMSECLEDGWEPAADPCVPATRQKLTRKLQFTKSE